VTTVLIPYGLVFLASHGLVVDTITLYWRVAAARVEYQE
jgi:hypothetical protein